jgi:hypothetical protein
MGIMSGFLSKCTLTVADNKDDGQWIVAAPLRYYSEKLAATLTVPAGFQTDLASVPRDLPIAFALFGATSDEAACLHDYLYANKGYWKYAVPRQPELQNAIGKYYENGPDKFIALARSTCDAILREASAASGVSWWRRWPMWAGVRLFGWFHWG